MTANKSLLLLLYVAIGGFVSAEEIISECTAYAPPAVIKGKKFFISTTGEYLPIKGINYYPRPNEGALTLGNSQDYFTEAFRHIWERDIEHLKALNINAIRLYAVDPGQNHDAFFCALKQAGIYVLVGLVADCENCAVQYQNAPDCYPVELKRRGEYIIQQFSKYENVVGFSAGNEVALSAAERLQNMPCQKQFLRDMRAYVQKCSSDAAGMRKIPVGLAFADNERDFKAQYYHCNSDPTTDVDGMQIPDFLGINAYLHCDGNATTIDELVGSQMLLDDASMYDLNMPFLWTEYGCANPTFPASADGTYGAQRNFLQVEALYSPEFREEFAGGFVFEYSTEKVYSEEFAPFPFDQYGPGNYGVVYFEPEGCNDIDVKCNYVRFPQFDTLAAQYAAVEDYVADEGDMLSYTWEDDDVAVMCPISEDGTISFPPLDSYPWPTLNEEGTACPELVPVYCADIPAECVTVPFPDVEEPITDDTDVVDDITNVTIALNTTEGELSMELEEPLDFNTTEGQLGLELEELLDEEEQNFQVEMIPPEDLEVETMAPTEPELEEIITMEPTAGASLEPTAAPTASEPEVLVAASVTTSAPSMAMTEEVTMAASMAMSSMGSSSDTMVSTSLSTSMETMAETAEDDAALTSAPSVAAPAPPTEVPTLTPLGEDAPKDLGQFQAPTSAAANQTLTWLALSSMMVVGAALQMLV